MNTPDNVHVMVPNSGIFGGIIKNYSVNATRRIDLTVGIAYDDDIGVAVKAIQDILGREDRLLGDPEPTIAVNELADSSIEIVVRPWCKREDYWSLRRGLTRSLKEGLEAAGCSFPFPQRDVHLYEAGKVAAG